MAVNAAKIALGLCICPVVATPPALMNERVRDKVAAKMGYVPAKKAKRVAAAKPKAKPRSGALARSAAGPRVAAATPRDAWLGRAGNPNEPCIVQVAAAQPAFTPMGYADAPAGARGPASAGSGGGAPPVFSGPIGGGGLPPLVPGVPGVPPGPVTPPITPPGAVPEPATWGMMMLGLGGIGAFMRGARRRRLRAA